MKVCDGKIVEATENELFSQYLKAGYDDVISFQDYLYRCKELGTIITPEDET